MILVTGGAGYIGSHTCVSLASEGLDFLILDNFSNSKPGVLRRLESIVGREVKFHDGDISDIKLVKKLLLENEISAVIHFAAYKAVGESCVDPLRYYINNVSGTIALMRAMRESNVGTLIFSSSATVYGEPFQVPVSEDAPLSALNPYGATKLMIERILADAFSADPDFWSFARLRYFNPVGAHESGIIGENPNGVPNNLLPYVAQVAAGVRPILNIFGHDYPTLDGTGVRDYIHVMDLAEGHLAALRYLKKNCGLLTVNLGTGYGTSVLQMVEAFKRVSGMPVPYQFLPRRPGDVAESWANPKLAENLLGWRASRSLDQMCLDAWRWQNFADENLVS